MGNESIKVRIVASAFGRSDEEVREDLKGPQSGSFGPLTIDDIIRIETIYWDSKRQMWVIPIVPLPDDGIAHDRYGVIIKKFSIGYSVLITQEIKWVLERLIAKARATGSTEPAKGMNPK